MSKYRLLIILICGLLTIGLQLAITKTRFGSRLRAAVDDQRVARGLGINVGAVFAITFAFGSGLAGLGGALGAEILGLDPTFPLKYMIYFLIVVTVGGTTEHHRAVPRLDPARHRRRRRQILCAEARRVRDLYDHDRGLDLAAAGPVRPQRGPVTRWPKPARRSHPILARRARWSPLEIAFWVFAFATIWLFPGKHLILTETAILALFALSLDLILGYAGIISLGQAAFFGLAGYCAGLLAKYGIINEPVVALIVSGLAAAALGFVTSFLVLRGSDLTRLMVTLGVALMLGELANRFSNITGGADGLQGVNIAPIFGRFRFDMFGHTGYIYCLVVLFVCFRDRAAHRLFAVRPVAALAERQSAAGRGDRHPGQPPADRDLHGLGRLRRHCRRPAHADHGFLLARRAFARALGRSAPGADHRRHRLSLWRLDRRGDLQIPAGLDRESDAAILAILDRLRAGRHRAGRPRARGELDCGVARRRSIGSASSW